MDTSTMTTIGLTLLAMAVILAVGVGLVWSYFRAGTGSWRRDPVRDPIPFGHWAPAAPSRRSGRDPQLTR